VALTPDTGALVSESPFDRLYGLELSPAEDGVVRGHVQVATKVTQPMGLVHGGVYASVAEALASIGTNQLVSREGRVALGMSNHTSFVRGVREGGVHGIARLVHRGNSTWLWEVEMVDDAERLCAVSRVTIAVRPSR
jgi:uncharacterized protein (TIGR00369 family)